MAATGTERSSPHGAPGTGSLGRKAEHAAGAVEDEAKHAAGAVEGEAKHAAGAVEGEAKHAAGAVEDEANRARQDRRFRRLARFGIACRGFIYIVLAYIAADIALSHHTPAQASGRGALIEVARQPGGPALMVVLAAGMASYACWRLAQALSPSNPAARALSNLERVGYLAGAGLYFFLCGEAASLVATGGAGSSGGGGAESHPQPVVAAVLRWPGGPVWVALVGAVIAGGGLALAIWGCVHDYSRVFDTGRTPRWAFVVAEWTGAAGEVARGLLVVLVSVYVFEAAAVDDPSKAKTMGEALLDFGRTSPGPALLCLSAFGLLCFAGYSALESLYRRL